MPLNTATRENEAATSSSSSSSSSDALVDPLGSDSLVDSSSALNKKKSPSIADRGALLSGHIGERAKQQALISDENKHGQGMAEALARGTNKAGANAAGVANEGEDMFSGNAAPAAMSQTLMDLVQLTQYDALKDKDVLLRSGDGSLKEEDKWTLAAVNSKMMSYIQPGMTINKIIPDSTVQSILKNGYMSDFKGINNKVGGSVAHSMNYNQGLTGAEATANFGLDYASYSDVNAKGEEVEVEQLKKPEDADVNGLMPTREKGAMPKELWHSEYVRDDSKGGLDAVENVFYVKCALPDASMDNVKVPIHPTLVAWANKRLKTINQIGHLEAEMAIHYPGATGAEIRNKVAEKKKMLSTFLERVATGGPQVTRKLSGEGSNPQDPLTNLGMTRQGSRLNTSFGTINQEYVITEYFELPPGSGLYLKDHSGKDTLVGTLKAAEQGGGARWGELREEILKAKLKANKNFGA
ncbi:MAG: hypothetical protein ACI9VR_000433 [Cognaticolwellia sp.]|jgi:hypothetical protein